MGKRNARSFIVVSGETMENQRGVTLFELLVAMLLLGLVSTMIYSVLSVSIGFTSKGENRIQAMAQEQGLLTLLHAQVNSAWFDTRRKQIRIEANGETLQLFTRQPLLHRKAGLVLAIYRFNAGEQALYYTEKLDFYNIDYTPDYVPDYDDMQALAKIGKPFELDYDAEAGVLTVTYGDSRYEFTPRCQKQLPAGAGIITQ